jgi:hypothetical protein
MVIICPQAQMKSLQDLSELSSEPGRLFICSYWGRLQVYHPFFPFILYLSCNKPIYISICDTGISILLFDSNNWNPTEISKRNSILRRTWLSWDIVKMIIRYGTNPQNPRAKVIHLKNQMGSDFLYANWYNMHFVNKMLRQQLKLTDYYKSNLV